MDLGFGGANQKLGQQLSKTLQASATVQEEALDAELTKYDDLLNDEDALEMLRERRLQQLKKQHQQQLLYKERGHGEYTELLPHQNVAKAFFEVCKQSERVVIHFYRPTTLYSTVFHKHLECLAAKHLETKFIKLNVDDSANNTDIQYLVEKLGIHILPTLVCIKHRMAVHHIRGLTQVGGEDCTTNTVAHVLAQYGVLLLSDDEQDMHEETLEKISNGLQHASLSSTRPSSGVRDGQDHHDEEE